MSLSLFNQTFTGDQLGAMLAALFGLGAVLITATSVRLAIEAHLCHSYDTSATS